MSLAQLPGPVQCALRLLPGALQAVELFPTTEKSGPCLLLLRGVTLPPEAFTAWLYESGLNWAATRVSRL